MAIGHCLAKLGFAKQWSGQQEPKIKAPIVECPETRTI